MRQASRAGIAWRTWARGANVAPDLNKYEKDETLQHPRCVFQLLKRHFARYTPEMVERYCGVSKESFLQCSEDVLRSFWPGEDRVNLLCGWLDATFDRRADHPMRSDLAVAAGKHGAAGRGDYGACAAMRRFRVRLMFRPCTTFFPDT